MARGVLITKIPRREPTRPMEARGTRVRYGQLGTCTAPGAAMTAAAVHGVTFTHSHSCPPVAWAYQQQLNDPQVDAS